jgi:hypothetical protein
MHAYNTESLRNLFLVKEARTWKKSGIISGEQLESIKSSYVSSFYPMSLI